MIRNNVQATITAARIRVSLESFLLMEPACRLRSKQYLILSMKLGEGEREGEGEGRGDCLLPCLIHNERK